jgi:hypothetical protein
MSEESTSSKGPVIAWLLTPLAALVLYVATWPVIEIKFTKLIPMPGAPNHFMGSTVTWRPSG